MTSHSDIHYMRAALSQARRGLGRVAPNPAVGCVIVKNGHVIAASHTGDGGRPHAEVRALEMAGLEAKDATVYVTLEPCAHHGKTPPCTGALIEAEVARVVVACEDPDPRVSGEGMRQLKIAGIEVETGVLEKEARALNAGFILRMTQNRPYVTLKCAISSDGKIAAAPGERTQISGVLAQRHMHLSRSLHDAIMVGSETYLVDQPKLTTRLSGVEHEAMRIILDRRGRIEIADGFEICRAGDIKTALAECAEKGITRLLVEGGAAIHQAFLASGLVDEVQLIRSPKELGEAGVAGLTEEELTEQYGFTLQKHRVLGEDTLHIFKV